jgi:hypothetical protein
MGDMEDGMQGNLSAFGTANRPGIPRSLNDIEYFYDAANRGFHRGRWQPWRDDGATRTTGVSISSNSK